MTDETNKLEALRARRQALEAEREKLLAERAARDELAGEEVALADLEALTKAEAEHGEFGKVISQVKTPMGCIILKKPKYGEYRRFQDGKQRYEEVETLVASCIVHPDLVTARKWLHEYPVINAACVNLIAKLAGSDFVGDALPK